MSFPPRRYVGAFFVFVNSKVRRRKSLNQDSTRRRARLGFGCKGCLVAMTPEQTPYKGDGRQSPRYRETFNRTRFNPRWRHGTADHVVVVNV